MKKYLLLIGIAIAMPAQADLKDHAMSEHLHRDAIKLLKNLHSFNITTCLQVDTPRRLKVCDKYIKRALFNAKDLKINISKAELMNKEYLKKLNTLRYEENAVMAKVVEKAMESGDRLTVKKLQDERRNIKALYFKNYLIREQARCPNEKLSVTC